MNNPLVTVQTTATARDKLAALRQQYHIRQPYLLEALVAWAHDADEATIRRILAEWFVTEPEMDR